MPTRRRVRVWYIDQVPGPSGKKQAFQYTELGAKRMDYLAPPSLPDWTTLPKPKLVAMDLCSQVRLRMHAPCME